MKKRKMKMQTPIRPVRPGRVSPSLSDLHPRECYAIRGSFLGPRRGSSRGCGMRPADGMARPRIRKKRGEELTVTALIPDAGTAIVPGRALPNPSDLHPRECYAIRGSFLGPWRGSSRGCGMRPADGMAPPRMRNRPPGPAHPTAHATVHAVETVGRRALSAESPCVNDGVNGYVPPSGGSWHVVPPSGGLPLAGHGEEKAA